MLRVRVELCPGGDCRPEAVTTLEEVYVVNDGTGAGVHHANEGGIGNYNVYSGPRPLDFAKWHGRIEGVERTSKHRLLIAAKALKILFDSPRSDGTGDG